MERSSKSNAEREQRAVKRRKPNGSCDDLSLNITSDKLRDPLLYMVGYLEHSELLMLCSVCKPLLGVVEKFSRQTLTQVMEEHQTDDSFQVRLKSRFKEGKIKTVPNRCLLKAAFETYLYKLEMFPGRESSSGQVAISKDGSRLVVAGTVQLNDRIPLRLSHHIYFWNLEDKNLIRTDEITALERGEYAIRKIFWVEGNKYVVCTMERLLVVQADSGELIHAYTHVTSMESVLQREDDSLILVDHNYNIFSFDVSTGVAELMAHLEGCSDELLKLLAVCQSRWLVLAVAGPREGLCVYDLQNDCTEASYHGGECTDGVEASHDDPTVFYTCGYNTLNALTLDEGSGNLNTSWTLPFPLESKEESDIFYRGTRGSRVFYETYPDDFDKKPFMAVQSTQTAKLQRRLKLPEGHLHYGFMVQSKGKEVFVGVESMTRHTGPRAKYGLVIAAYIANDNLLKKVSQDR